MNIKESIKVTDKNITYLSQLNEMKDLPAGILNKSETGCGATTIVLSNDINYIIAVPITELITNKVDTYGDSVLGVYTGVKIDKIRSYISDQSIPVKKIMVTYDSLPKVMKELGDRINDYQIAVDEFHNINTAYLYRSDAIIKMLECLKPYIKDVRFISATPLNEKVFPEYMKDLDYTEVIWEHSKKAEVIWQYSKSPCRMASAIINDYKNGLAPTKVINGVNVVSDEAFFFVNCVNDIIAIIKHSGIKPEETRIICSNKDDNRNKLPKGFEIKRLRKKESQILEHQEGVCFTFITKTGFEGVDIFSEKGAIYVVSDTTKVCNCLDISAEMKQIAGRIRTLTNPFNNNIYHITNTISEGDSPEEAEKKIQKGIELGEAHLSLPHEHAIDTIARCEKGILNEFYFHTVKTDIFGNKTVEFDELKMLSMRWFYVNTLPMYRNGFFIRQAHEESNRVVKVDQGVPEHLINCPTLERPKKENAMEKKVELYEQIMCTSANTWVQTQFEKDPKNKTFMLAWEFLGKTKMKALQYREGAIKKELQAKLIAGTVVAQDVCKAFQVGQRYAKSDIKTRMQALYQKNGLTATPKASDLELYFNIKGCKMSDSSHGFEILSKRTETQKQAEKLRLVIEQLGGLD